MIKKPDTIFFLILITLCILAGCKGNSEVSKDSLLQNSTLASKESESDLFDANGEDAVNKEDNLGENMNPVTQRIIKILTEYGEDENLNSLLKEELDKLVHEGLLTEYHFDDNGTIKLIYPDGSESGIMTTPFTTGMN
ncbi:hypothetical protein [Butyrivibrio sp. AE3004]|uniref:hypothetical protein n=1 Tax=Butyrivibrio sp. AE3004 TaxID=1506994 RepID=UPI0004949364|nr:hypothetical protein [Butyrivibrio sp. AE3004]